jgi:hypothetical protein
MPAEESFEVTDKRRVHLDTDSAPLEAEAVEDPGEAGPSLPPMDVYALLKTTIGMLSNGAWGWMGLSPNPFTGEMERDMAQAKIAIDCVTYLVAQVDPHLEEADRREMQNVVSMLRVNYVQQLSKG